MNVIERWNSGWWLRVGETLVQQCYHWTEFILWQSSEYEQLCVSNALTYIVDEILTKICATKRDEQVIYIPI